MIYIKDDKLITMSMSIGYMFNLMGRFFWAFLAEKIGFKAVVTSLAILMGLICCSFPFAMHYSMIYCGIIVLSFLSCSAIYPLILL
mmetsp:Transcript_8364/g.1124  ORF Transcript_8364/g.1124 Transcript_8364/m.1124 type:complete len:86 (+) Transcript_8364:762-1019(+)